MTTQAKAIRVAVVGVGLVGSEFVSQLLALPSEMFRLVSLSTSRATLFSADGLSVNPTNWRQSFEKAATPTILSALLGELQSIVNSGNKADFFMWEHFTTKKYYDNGELKRVGDIYTPWPSWMIVARNATDKRIEDMAEKLNKGVKKFRENQEEAVQHITSTMEYSKEDAEAWLKTVRFADDVRGVDSGVVEKTIQIRYAAHSTKAACLLSESVSGDDRLTFWLSLYGSSQAPIFPDLRLLDGKPDPPAARLTLAWQRLASWHTGRHSI